VQNQAFYNRLNEIVRKYPEQSKMILEDMGINNVPSPEALLVAYAKNSERLLDSLMSLRPHSFGEHADWFTARETARAHNMAVSTKQVNPMLELGAMQVPVNFNPELGGSGMFHGSEHFKAPLKLVGIQEKGVVSSNVSIGSDSGLKQSIIRSSEPMEEVSEELEPVPASRDLLKTVLDSLYDGAVKTGAGGILKKAQIEGQKEELKAASLNQKISEALDYEQPPIVNEFNFSWDRVGLWVAVSVVLLVAAFYFGGKTE